jgi:Rrf2 family protein
MQPYGKVAQAAICATSLLAEHYDSHTPQRFSSGDIAKQRKLSQAIVAKVLTTLSQVGVVTGAPGPGGGYTLSRAPSEITLLDVVAPFERIEPDIVCPYGEAWCGVGPHCPLHHQLVKFQADVAKFLSVTTLNSFRLAARKRSAPER